MKIMVIVIVMTQLFDIVIHAVTHQLELLRVSSNLVILLWLAIVASGRFSTKSLRMAVVAIVAYLSLNLIFLALEGPTVEGGGLRVTLFVLIFITVTLSILLTYIRDAGRHPPG